MGVLVGKQAPRFKAQAVVNGQIIDHFSVPCDSGKVVILFFYPLDFTFVCPTELHAFQEKLAEFQKRNCEVIACSIDSAFSHLAWLNTPKSQGGIQGVHYPIVSDLTKNISKAYDVLTDDGVSYRGLFLIDKEGFVRHQVVNDLPLGRSVDEALRMVDALNFFNIHGEVCPANWRPGEASMKPTQESLKDYFSHIPTE